MPLCPIQHLRFAIKAALNSTCRWPARPQIVADLFALVLQPVLGWSVISHLRLIRIEPFCHHFPLAALKRRWVDDARATAHGSRSTSDGRSRTASYGGLGSAAYGGPRATSDGWPRATTYGGSDGSDGYGAGNDGDPASTINVPAPRARATVAVRSSPASGGREGREPAVSQVQHPADYQLQGTLPRAFICTVCYVVDTVAHPVLLVVCSADVRSILSNGVDARIHVENVGS